MTTELTKADSGNDLVAIINSAMPELKRVAPRFVNLARLTSLAIEAKMRNPLLANCSPVSVLNFCKKCAEVGTDRVGAGGMWAVPFWSNKNKCFDMTPIPDWRLIIEKCKKAKAITHATAEAVYDADQFEYSRGMNPNLVHVPARKDRGKLVAVYCIYTLPDGTKDFCVMDWEQDVIPIRDRTNAWKSWKEKGASNPWVTDEAEQGKKTVVKRALKPFEGASPELTAMIELDNAHMGYSQDADVLRVPVAMPIARTAIDTTATETTPDAPAKTEHAKPEGDVVRGLVEDIAEKTGKTKKGTDWTRYGIKVGGVVYGTFKKEHAEIARDAQVQEKPVALAWLKEGEHLNVASINVEDHAGLTDAEKADIEARELKGELPL